MKDFPEALASLAVIRRLEVGPVALAPDRLTCPYVVETAEGRFTTSLSCKYEEPVFDPAGAEDLNLASVIAAQVALNYGLFADEIVFRGPFSGADRVFLREMARNTAREIFVKKFLEDNPFLLGEARNLPPLKLKSYLRARLVFPDKGPEKPASPFGEPGKGVAVLSSGGKESLLSYAVLDEIGREAHPIFINESGRHWFTALNAYRGFKETIPLTARVWTDADRLFAWMLRRLPFVRQDFASIRSDEYPIRLWTVAVLLFPALPLLRKRGLRMLVVGDEHDTTRRAVSHGIRHYDGLFDQSIFFDQALSAYFHDKGWRVSQFSILRPLSELLIQRILCERYPDLQRYQVSCHAALHDKDSIKPCGRCEKCRRIVGMISALGADPAACGYTPSQVENALARLAHEGVHQEAECAMHVLDMLGKKGLLPESAEGAKARPRPEVMKLRFDAVRSPLDAIPRELRRPLYGLFLSHATGAVRRQGKRWVDFDLMADPALDRPYGHDAPAGGGAQPGQGVSEVELGKLTWPMAGRRLKEVDLALLPVGSIEQHGPHLPLDTDAYDAERLAMEAARRTGRPRPLVLPLIPYGVAYHHDDFPGTLSISPESLSRIVYEVGMAAARHGITKLVIVNGHGGNIPALNFAAQNINRDARIFICVESGETSDADIEAMIETANDVHAGETETSTALATRPELVRMERAESMVPRFSSRYLDFTSARSVSWYAYTAKISPSGVLGDPGKASADKGRRIWELMVERLAEFLEHIKELTLQEIHQKRY